MRAAFGRCAAALFRTAWLGFRNVNQGKPHAYHDALEFPDGEVVLLTELREGQHATVLQLPVGQEAEAKHAQVHQETSQRTPQLTSRL